MAYSTDPLIANRCDTCPALRLETALPIVLRSNQQALDSITRLYSRLSNPDQFPIELGDVVNRVTRLADGRELDMPLIADLGSPRSQSNSDDEADMPPIWQVTIAAAKDIFEKIVGREQARLVWAASSINPPNHHSTKSNSQQSPLGFKDVVILHSNPTLTISGKEVLKNAQDNEGFVSLSYEFFPQIAKAKISKSDQKLLTTPAFGVWIRPVEEDPSVPSTDRSTLIVECTSDSLPPELVSPEGLLQRTYSSWRKRYIADGTLSRYFAPFDVLVRIPGHVNNHSGVM